MPGVFISYRRDDTAGYAGRLYDDLNDALGSDRVFIDIEKITPGEDFVEAINRSVSSCDVLLMLIGPSWLTATDSSGRRRIDDPEDIHRLEISAASLRKVAVIPVLVHDARMPGRAELPDEIANLARHQAFELSDANWRDDVRRLALILERALAKSTAPKEEDSRPKPVLAESAPPNAEVTEHKRGLPRLPLGVVRVGLIVGVLGLVLIALLSRFCGPSEVFIVRVTTGEGGAFLRETPALSATRVGASLVNGNRVTGLGRPQATSGGTWWRVRADDGREGWLREDWLAPATNVSTQPPTVGPSKPSVTLTPVPSPARK